MRLLALVTAVVLAAAPAYADDKLQVVAQKAGRGTVRLNAVNPLPCAVTVDLELQLENMRTDAPHTVVVPAGGRMTMATLSPTGPGRTHYNFHYHYMLGDASARPTDTVYRLPFKRGTRSKVSQGYFGKFSHQTVHALDFLVPEGTTVVAARDGVVVSTEDRYSQGGTTDEFKARANYVVLAHADGTLARYLHLQHGGALVRVGQRVRMGQAIALSGNTGYSTQPHLHFELDVPRDGHGYRTFPSRFATADEPGGQALSQGLSYTAP